MAVESAAISTLRQMIQRAQRIVFFGGAGVSTESGIPDFRSENGIFQAMNRYGLPPEELLSHSFFIRNPQTFYDYYRNNLLITDVRPNDAHLALAKLEQDGKLQAVITQNIDGLHQKAGSKNVFELHGSIYRNYCMNCGRKATIQEVAHSTGIPRCPDCSGIIRPDVVLYEEGLDQDVINGAIQAISKADLFIVGGTSLVVYPAAGLLRYYRGKDTVLINLSETAYDEQASLVIREPIGAVLRTVLEG